MIAKLSVMSNSGIPNTNTSRHLKSDLLWLQQFPWLSFQVGRAITTHMYTCRGELYPCVLNYTNMPIKTQAWYFKERIRLLPTSRIAHCQALKQSTEWNRDASMTETFSWTRMTIFPDWEMLVFHLWFVGVQQRYDGGATRLETEGTCDSSEERNMTCNM